MNEEHNHNDETRAFNAVLTRADLAHLESKIDGLSDSLRTMATELKTQNERHAQNDVWKGQIDLRLINGIERMNRIEADMRIAIESLDKKLAGMVKKETLLAYFAGCGIAGAGLMKIFGG